MQLNISWKETYSELDNKKIIIDFKKLCYRKCSEHIVCAC